MSDISTGNKSHIGVITNWNYNDGNDASQFLWSTTDSVNMVIDFAELHNIQNPDMNKTDVLSCNSLTIAFKDTDAGFVFLKKTKKGLSPVFNSVVGVPNGTTSIDVGFSFNGIKLMCPSGTKYRFVADIF